VGPMDIIQVRKINGTWFKEKTDKGEIINRRESPELDDYAQL